MRYLAPLILLVLIAGHAMAGSGPATASHAPVGPATAERIAAVALAVLLVLGLARLHRSSR